MICIFDRLFGIFCGSGHVFLVVDIVAIWYLETKHFHTKLKELHFSKKCLMGHPWVEWCSGMVKN